MSRSLSARRIWGMPIVLALLSAIGLLSALLGDGIWNFLSWIALAIPVITVVWFLYRAPSVTSMRR